MTNNWNTINRGNAYSQIEILLQTYWDCSILTKYIYVFTTRVEEMYENKNELF